MIFFLVIGNLSLFARKNVQLTSPNGKLKFSLTLEREHPVYDIHKWYLQPIITQYFIDNKSEIWLLFLIAHSKR